MALAILFFITAVMQFVQAIQGLFFDWSAPIYAQVVDNLILTAFLVLFGIVEYVTYKEKKTKEDGQ